MPVLEKQRYELFAVGIAKGLSAPESYASAGFRGKGPAASAIRLLKKQEIATRIAELSAITAARAAGIPDITATELSIIELQGQIREKGERHKALKQIRDERIATYTDPENEMVRRLTGTKTGEKPNLRKLPGIATGFVVIEMKLLGKTAVPVLRQDTALLRELSELEAEIAQLKGFLKPMQVNVDARQQTQNNTVIVKMVTCEEDLSGQW